MSRILLHGVTGQPGTAFAKWLDTGPHFPDAYRPLVGATPRIVTRLSGAGVQPDDHGGAAAAEATAVRLRRQGASLEWGEPDQTVDLRRLLRLCRARGRSSVELLRRDATLCGELQIGSWFDAPLRARIVRRVALHAPGVLLSLARSPRGFRTAADSAFWKGVRSAATRAEWKRLTGASFTALVYHRIAGEAKPGQEKLDTPARLFEAQLRLLRTMRFRPLAASELLRVLKGEADPPRRSFVLTFDDAMLDCLDALHRHTREAPILFVPTHELGAKAHWLGDEPTMAWDDVRALAAAGVAIGAHARRHRPLVGLPEEELADELEGSLADLRERIPEAWALLAYPNGAHDLSVRAAAMRAGFEAAFTTEKGKNGPATDRLCLRRISVYGYDGPLAVAWKAATGEPVPRLFERWRLARLRRTGSAPSTDPGPSAG